MADDLRKLKDEAARLSDKGKHAKAAELYARVADREPEDPQWSQRAGEAWKRAGNQNEALHHFVAAAEAYARHGFLLKAIAMAKLVLSIDPKHTRTHQMVASLYSKEASQSARPPPPLVPPPPRTPTKKPPAAGGIPVVSASRAPLEPVRQAEPVARMAERYDLLDRPSEDTTPLPVLPILPGATVDTLPLSEVIHGSKPAEGMRQTYEIPLYDSQELEAVYQEEHAAQNPPTLPPEFMIEVGAEAPLPTIPLFSSLDEYHLRRLIEKVRIVDVGAGEPIYSEGETGESMYVVVRGEVESRIASHDSPVARHGEGSFFGELAVLTDSPRPSTILARGPAQILEMDRRAITSLIKDDPAVLRTLLRFCRDRLIDRLVSTSPLFSGFSEKDARALADRFSFLEIDPGGPLLTEWQRAPGLFLLLCGSADAIARNQRIDALGPGDMCGEVSLLSRAPSVASVIARTKVWALFMKRMEFQELMAAYPQMLAFLSERAEKQREKLRVAGIVI
jgi:CRP-like cAMP-binding protein